MFRVMKIARIGLLIGVTLLTSLLAEEEKTPMQKEMGKASSALKSLRKIKKDDWAGMVQASRQAHEAFLKSMAYQSSFIKEMKEGKEKEVALADSRRLMGLSYAALCELEIAYLEQDQEKVAKAMKKIKALKKEGHEKYTDD